MLVDGAVQFDIDTDTRKQQLRMEPGDLVLYDRVSNDINLSTFQPEHFKSFADNRAIHFFNLRMHDIALDLERLFGTRIVILDEATASIDPENEAVIQQAISRLTKGKTLIVIAHRLGTVAGADNIVVVEGGRIAAQGKQEELLASCPLYRQMWQSYLGVRDGEEE